MAQEAPKVSQTSSEFEILQHTSKSTDNDNNSNQCRETSSNKIPQDTHTAVEDSKESNEKKNDKNENKSNENVKRDESKSPSKQNHCNQTGKIRDLDTLNKIPQSTNVTNVNNNIEKNSEEKINSDQVLNSIIVKHSEFEGYDVIDLNPLLKALSSSNQAHHVLKTEFHKRYLIYDKQTDILHLKSTQFQNNYKLKMSLKSSDKTSIQSS